VKIRALVFCSPPHRCSYRRSRQSIKSPEDSSPAPWRRSSIMAYKGIPFCRPPVGNLRWRAPQRLFPCRRSQADKFSASCISGSSKSSPLTYEFMTHTRSRRLSLSQCLTPAKRPPQSLSLFTLRGGSIGSARCRSMVRGLPRRSVVVTFNYA